MAEYDGAVRVDTRFNSKGFDDGVARLEKAMQSLSDTMEKLGRTIDSSFKGYVKAMQGAGAATRQVETALDGAADKTEHISAAADKTAESYGKVAQEADKAKTAADKIGSQTVKGDGYATLEKQISKASDALDRLIAKKNKMNALETDKDSKAYKSLEYDIAKAAEKLKGLRIEKELFFTGNASENSGFSSLSASIAQAEAALDRFENKVDKMSAVGATDKAWDSIGWDIRSAAYDAEKLKETLDGLKQSGGIGDEDYSKISAQLDGVLARYNALYQTIYDEDRPVESIRQMETELKAFQEQVSELSGSDIGFFKWSDILDSIINAKEEAESLRDTIEELYDSGPLFQVEYEDFTQQIENAVDAYQNLIDEVKNSNQSWASSYRIYEAITNVLGGAIVNAFKAVGTTAKFATLSVANLAQAAARLVTAFAKITVSTILYFMRTLAASAGEAARNLAKLTASAVSSGIKRLGGWLSNAARSMLLFGRQTKRSNNVLKKSFTTLLKYGLGVRSFYYLFRKVRQAIAEGYQNLARYSDTLNASISGVISSFKRSENQFAASFAPLVNAIAPAVAQLIDGLTEATFRAGEFIATLSGQKTVIKAKKVQEDYAASLQETKKAAKDAKNQLAGFDKLEILKEKDEHTDPNDMFETVPVGDEAKQFADDFKEAWINVDLSGIGEIVGGKIKVALDNIPWPDIQQGAEDSGKRLATFLNGLINVLDLGKSLGKSIAEAINTAFSSLDGFVWEFGWESLGNAIMDAVEAACDNLNWELINHALQGLAIGLADLLNTIFSRKEVWEKIGVTIGKALNAAVLFGLTFLERFDFNQAASAIVAGLNAAVSTIRFDNIGQLLGDLLGGALQFLYTAVTDFDWEGLGNQIAVGMNAFTSTVRRRIYDINWADIGAAIADGINTAIIGIEWGGVGETVGMLLGGALTAAASFIRGLEYGEIVQAIQDFFSNAIQQIDFYDLLTVWGVAALIVAVKRIITTHPVLALLVGAVLALGPELGNTIQKMIDDISWADVGKAISDSLIWALNRLNEAAENADWVAISESLFHGLTEMVLNIDWLKLVRLLGEWLINCFAMSVDIALGAIGGIFSAIGEALEEAGHDVIGGFFKGIGDWFTGVGKWLRQNVFDPFIGWFKKLFGIASPSTVMAEMGGYLIEGLFNGISAAWHFITDFFGDALEGLKTTLGGAWETISGAASTAWNGISTTLSSIMGGIVSNIGGAWETIKTSASAKWNEVTSSLGKTWENIKTAASEKFLNIATHISEKWDDIKKSTSDKWGKVKSSLNKTWDNINANVKEKFSGIRSSVSDAWDTIKSGTANTLSEIENTASDKWGNLKSVTFSAWNGIKDSIKNMTSGIKQESISDIADSTSAIGAHWEGLKASTSSKWGEIKMSVEQSASSLKQSTIRDVSEIVSGLSTRWQQMGNDAASKWTQLQSSVVTSANNIKSQITTAFSSLQGTLSSVWGNISSVASSALSSISNTVGSMASSVSSAINSVRSMASNVASTVSGALSTTTSEIRGLNQQIDSTQEKSEKAQRAAEKNARAQAQKEQRAAEAAKKASQKNNLAAGGIVYNNGHIRSWYDSVRKYASGTTRAMGSLFVAGEAGPEIVGHVNGRTEVLNESQIAGAIYGAVLSAMSETIKTLGGFLSQQMASNTNALISAIGQMQAPPQIAAPQDTAMLERLTALQAVPYQIPAYATGTVMPYEVVAEIRKQTSELKTAIYDNGEIVIQAIVSAISNHGLAITNAIGNIQTAPQQGHDSELQARYTVDYINRQTRMLGKSPLMS